MAPTCGSKSTSGREWTVTAGDSIFGLCGGGNRDCVGVSDSPSMGCFIGDEGRWGITRAPNSSGAVDILTIADGRSKEERDGENDLGVSEWHDKRIEQRVDDRTTNRGSTIKIDTSLMLIIFPFPLKGYPDRTLTD